MSLRTGPPFVFISINDFSYGSFERHDFFFSKLLVSSSPRLLPTSIISFCLLIPAPPPPACAFSHPVSAARPPTVRRFSFVLHRFPPRGTRFGRFVPGSFSSTSLLIPPWVFPLTSFVFRTSFLPTVLDETPNPVLFRLVDEPRFPL